MVAISMARSTTVLELVAVAQLVVPLHQLAHHAGLVEHLLRPVDAGVARAELAELGDRLAPGGEEIGTWSRAALSQPVDAVRGADIDVEHHRLRPAGHR